jgi:hypothetical protein
LFDAADTDRSGGINRIEFARIVGALCAQILSRMLVYYVVLILCVPYVSTKVVDLMGVPSGSYMEMAAEKVVYTALWMLVIPNVWNTIDERTQRRIVETARSTTGGTNDEPKAESEKKDE